MKQKPLDIKIKNEQPIENALSTVNGRANTYTFCSFDDILRMADLADKKMDDLGMVKSKSVGAQFLAESSGPVANAYDSTRIGTQVILIRCWALSHIERITLYPQDGGKRVLSLTQEQSNYAIAKFSKKFKIIPPKEDTELSAKIDQLES